MIDVNLILFDFILVAARTKDTGKTGNDTAWASNREAVGFTGASGRKDLKAVTVSANR